MKTFLWLGKESLRPLDPNDIPINMSFKMGYAQIVESQLVDI